MGLRRQGVCLMYLANDLSSVGRDQDVIEATVTKRSDSWRLLGGQYNTSNLGFDMISGVV